MVLLGIITWFIIIPAQADYSWSKTVINNKEKEGWIVASTQDNFIDLLHPWMIFKPVITRIAFVKPEMEEVSNGYYLIDLLWVDYENLSRTEELQVKNVVSCLDNRSAYVDEHLMIQSNNLDSLEWRTSEPDTPGEGVVSFVCKNKD